MTNSQNIITINSRRDVAIEIRNKFNPLAIVDIFSGNWLALNDMKQLYGLTQTEIFVALAIRELNEFTALEKKLSMQQIDKLSNIILDEYGYLKTSELLLFVHKFKAGEYGEFFRSIDSLKITSALKRFIEYRERIQESIERMAENKKRDIEYEEHKMGCISGDDYAKKYGFKNELLRKTMQNL